MDNYWYIMKPNSKMYLLKFLGLLPYKVHFYINNEIYSGFMMDEDVFNNFLIKINKSSYPKTILFDNNKLLIYDQNKKVLYLENLIDEKRLNQIKNILKVIGYPDIKIIRKDIEKEAIKNNVIGKKKSKKIVDLPSHILDIPLDILTYQLSYLSFQEIIKYKYINKEWYKLLNENSSIWCILLEYTYKIKNNNSPICYNKCRELSGYIKLKYDKNLIKSLAKSVKNTKKIFVIKSSSDKETKKYFGSHRLNQNSEIYYFLDGDDLMKNEEMKNILGNKIKLYFETHYFNDDNYDYIFISDYKSIE
jgi:hypothetical protein